MHVNIYAVLAAAASSFLLGGLWYSPALFGEIWKREAADIRTKADRHPAKVFGFSFLFALIAALAYACLIPAATSPLNAASQGLAIGGGVVAASFGINYQFANRSAKLLLIDGGYHTLQFLIYGLILGLWR